MSQARRIGPFALAEVLGEGHGTTLYRAVRPAGSRPPHEVCIRVAKDPLDTLVSGAIRKEYEILRVMDNPRIPKAYGHYADEAAIAMSYYAGVSLTDVLQARKDGLVNIATGTAIDLIVEVAHALRHANSIVGSDGVRIAHGHLGPQRVRVTPDGNIVVVGFGAAPKGIHPAYTPPEIARGGEPKPVSDQWSLGAILVELILGERLYTGVGDVDVAARAGDVQHWVSAASQKHPQLELLLRTMLAKDPADRFDRGHELLKSLLAAERQIGGTVNRRSLTTSVLAHADKLSRVRPVKQAAPLPVAPTPTERSEPAVPYGLGMGEELEPSPALQTAPSWLDSLSLPVPKESQPDSSPAFTPDHTAPPAPDPAPRLLPSEFAGMALGGLMFLLGITYVFWVV